MSAATAVSPKQTLWIERCLRERVVTDAQRAWVAETLGSGVPTGAAAHQVLDVLFGLPRLPRADGVPEGVYVRGGQLFVVKRGKPRKDWSGNVTRPGNLYAMRLVDSPPRVLASTGKVVSAELEYDRDAYAGLTLADRAPLSDVHDYLVRYGRCVRCHRGLRAASTLEKAEATGQMVGPVCIKFYEGGGY